MGESEPAALHRCFCHFFARFLLFAPAFSLFLPRPAFSCYSTLPAPRSRSALIATTAPWLPRPLFSYRTPLFLPFFTRSLLFAPVSACFLPRPAFSYYPTHSAPPSRPACPATTLPRPKLFCYDKSPARKKRKIRNRKPRFHAEKRAGAEIFAHKGGRSLGWPLFQTNTKNVSRETKRREKRPLRAYSTRLSDRTKAKCFT